MACAFFRRMLPTEIGVARSLSGVGQGGEGPRLPKRSYLRLQPFFRQHAGGSVACAFFRRMLPTEIGVARSLSGVGQGGEGPRLPQRTRNPEKTCNATRKCIPCLLCPLSFPRPCLRCKSRCLPPNRSKWPEDLKAQRDLYARFVQDLILKPAENVTQGGGSGAACAGDTSLARLAHGTSVQDAALTGLASGGERIEDAGIDGTVGARQGVGKDGTQNGLEAASLEVPTRVENVTVGSNSTRENSRGRNTGSEDASDGDSVRGKPPLAAKVTFTSIARYAPSSGASEKSRRDSRVNAELIPADDDPLSNKESSEWAALWSDKELMQAIEQDVVRTMPDLAFYACRTIEDGDEDDAIEVRDNLAEGEAGERKRDEGEQKRQGRQRRMAISRILFVHAKLNPAESYTQGMNEIVATLYFVLATDESEEWRRHSEADTFFCFTNLMSEIRDVFIQSMDDSENGLHGKMEALSRTLRQHDPELAQHMVRRESGLMSNNRVTRRRLLVWVWVWVFLLLIGSCRSQFLRMRHRCPSRLWSLSLGMHLTNITQFFVM